MKFNRSSLVGGGLVAFMTAAMMLPPAQADARRWYDSRAAWATYGVTGGLIVGHALWGDHRPRQRTTHRTTHRHVYHHHYQPAPAYHHAPVYHAPPSYGPVCQTAAPAGHYTYRERRVWPFYRRVHAEYIPALPPAPYGTRPAAVSMAELRREQQAQEQRPIVINIYNEDGSKRTVEAEVGDNASENGSTARIEEIRYIANERPQAAPVRRVAVSNRAGAEFDEATAAVQSHRDSERPMMVRYEQDAEVERSQDVQFAVNRPEAATTTVPVQRTGTETATRTLPARERAEVVTVSSRTAR